MKDISTAIHHVLGILLLLPLSSIGQIQGQVNGHIDSLKLKIALTEGREAVDVFNLISWAYRDINIDSAITYGQKGYDLSMIIGYKHGTNESLNFLGVFYRNKSNYYKAQEIFFQALKSSEESNDTTQICYALINIGNVLYYQKNYESAIAHFVQALEKAETTHNKDQIAYSHLNIGRCYSSLNKFDLAKTHIEKSRKIRQELGDWQGIAKLQIDIAELSLNQGQTDQAIKLFEENLILITKLNVVSSMVVSFGHLAQAYYQKGDLDMSFHYATKCLIYARTYGQKSIESEVLGLIAKIYEQKKDYKKALDYYRQHLQSRDSIFSSDQTRKIDALQNQYDTEKQEIATKHLVEQGILNDAIIKRQSLLIGSFVLTIILLIVMVISFYWSSSQRRKLNLEIQKQKEAAFKHNNDLIDINKEKNNFIRILTHDLRAPINNIKGLIDVHQMDNKDKFNEEENYTLNLIKSESDRMLNLISKLLNTDTLDSKESTMKSEKVDLVSVLDHAILSFAQAAKSKELDIVKKYKKTPSYIIADTIHIRQVVENLLSNALKFTEPQKKIFLNIKVDNDHIQLRIKDQGPGLTEEDKTKIFKKFQKLSARPTANEESIGLGLSIVKRYVEEMNGSIWYESELGVGSTFIVQFDRILEET